MEPAPREGGHVPEAAGAAGEDAPAATVETLQTRLRAASRGDESAFADVYDLAAPRVYGLVRAILWDAQQAEEVTQEVFLQVWESSNRFDPARGSALAWILGVAHRRAVDRARSAGAARATTEANRVGGVLDLLSWTQRQALELAYFGGHTHLEVSRLLDLPPTTAKTRIRDGLIRVRDGLALSRIS